MKRGTLNFLGRKNQSLFDTNIKIKDMDNVELVLESSAIPESGTASVRARPTVKHHASPSLESFQGFAVPTPKVPLLPPVNGPKINGSVSGDKISNGSAPSVPDLLEGELFIPPAPSMAPPPPPSMAPPPPPSAVPSPSFIPPPPDFMGDMNNLNLATLQHPTTPAAKPAPLSPSLEEQDLTLLKPPPMAPPKPPSTSSSGSASSLRISSPPTVNIPEHPKFAPPQPPSEGQHKTHKTPPPKPVRLSSMSHLDSPPLTPAPPPPVQTPTRSTFNPQNTAKLYNVPKPSILSYEDRDTRPKQMLLLEDSGSVNSAPVLVQVDGNAPKVATPAKPVSKDVQELKENLQMTKPSPPPLPEPDKEAKTEIVSASPKTDKPVLTPQQTSPQLPKMNKTLTNSEPYKDKLDASPSQGHKFSPLLDRKLRSLKASDSNGVREGHAASPLALLMAAKEREKQRSTHTVSRENSAKKNEPPCASIQPSVSSPNSFIVTPRSSSSSSLTSQEKLHESPKSVRPAENTQLMQTPQKSSKDQMPSISSTLSQETASPSVIGLVEQKQKIEQTPSKSPFKQNESNKEELSMPLLPPPPEFDDADEFMEPPPSIVPPAPPSIPSPAPPAIPPPAPPSIVPPAPPSTSTPAPPAIPPPAPPSTTTPAPPAIPPSDAPTKKAPAATGSHLPVSQAPSPPTPPKPPKAPKLPPSDVDVKPRPPVLTKPKTAPNQLPSPLSPNQATLLSILQKKMLEMDHKMAPVKEAESSADDWGAPLSDEDNKVPVVSKATPQSKNTPVVNKGATLDMRELENKVARKYQETSTIKSPTSNGVQSKHQYGMTFTVRPGTKQPITLKGDP